VKQEYGDLGTNGEIADAIEGVLRDDECDL
jgi:hypothetical protein